MQDFRMETFLVVCEHMNFTKAAQKLGLTQPAVSQQIHFLEKEYQVQLFELKGRKVRLTEAGKLLKSAALTMKHDEIYLKNRMNQVRQKRKDYMFGATLTAAEFILPPRLVEFQKNHPESRIRLQVENTEKLLRGLDEGELDFAVIEGYFPKEDYDHFLFGREEYLPICQKGGAKRLGGKTLEQLLGETLIIRENGSGTREVLEKVLSEQNLVTDDFHNILEIGNIGVIKALTKAGCGITFLYRAAVEKEIHSGQLEIIELRDWKQSHELMFIFRKGSIFQEEYQEIFEQISSTN